MEDTHDLKHLVKVIQAGINLKTIELEHLNETKSKLLKRLSDSPELSFAEFKKFYHEVKELRGK